MATVVAPIIFERQSMVLENKLGITGSVELARKEGLLTKRKALELYDERLLATFEVGTCDGS